MARIVPPRLSWMMCVGKASPTMAPTMAIVGAMVGLALPTHIIQLSLGGTILAIVVIMLSASKSEMPHVE